MIGTLIAWQGVLPRRCVMEQMLVKLEVRDRGTVLSARSSQVPGLHIYGATPEAVRKSAMLAIPHLLQHNRGMLNVKAHPTDDLSEIRVTYGVQ